jgi:hypothetical protein
MQYHIVWVTRFRRKILVEGVTKYLRVKLREVQKDYPDWHFTEIGIDKDHVHMHVVIPPKYIRREFRGGDDQEEHGEIMVSGTIVFTNMTSATTAVIVNDDRRPLSNQRLGTCVSARRLALVESLRAVIQALDTSNNGS